MDEWKKRLLLECHPFSVTAMALKEEARFACFKHGQSPWDADVARVVRDAELAMAVQHAASLAHLRGLRFASSNNIAQFSTDIEIRRLEQANYLYKSSFSDSILNEAQRIAEASQTSAMPWALETFRTPTSAFADKLLYLQSLDVIKPPEYLEAFMHSSAISDSFARSAYVGHGLHEATEQFMRESVPTFSSLAGYRQFLDAAGLHLSHWPHPRLLTIGEKRRRFRLQVNSNKAQKHVEKARSIVHRYELTLRDILDEQMASAYGEDWAEARLPHCDCKDLLGKWRKRGGTILEHADYAHYERIMTHSEHHEALFKDGFEDPEQLSTLIRKAGQLRAALQHFHAFSQEDLRDLRVVWRTIETGLLALTADYDFAV